MLSAVNLAKLYDETRGLHATSFSLRDGEFVALVGPNGAGKSTLLKLLAGWIRPKSGFIAINGKESVELRELVRYVGFVPEHPNLYDHFSVESNLNLFGDLFGLPRRRIKDSMARFDLDVIRGKKVGTLSKGQKQRVSLCRTLLADPKLIILDEPTSGLDIERAAEFRDYLREFREVGKSVLFSTHRPDDVDKLATRLLALNEGRITFDGSPSGYQTFPAKGLLS